MSSVELHWIVPRSKTGEMKISPEGQTRARICSSFPDPLYAERSVASSQFRVASIRTVVRLKAENPLIAVRLSSPINF
ncbi:hypothetical protein V511_00870 [Mesotoga sp. Brook.08.YT.4.2.5.1]|nr:hypothetical protein V511_00870 [Mesotoga sp. Brook.08.YT.4.2.5.1]RAO97202.1 hypothetical protein M388_11215 [Mesotoga sp. Brook.08.YT.4.2.5.4.]RDI91511.1 hypothetical protein Q502_10890 [Mesotoga sp. Brook.08.YT.4.2.5.2.]